MQLCFHLLPSGLVNPKCLNLIGSSVVAHIPTFFKELEELERKGLSNVHERIFIAIEFILTLTSILPSTAWRKSSWESAKSELRAKASVPRTAPRRREVAFG
ncbi:hypothetical protein L249_0210 [Ophiocordyceps polyrhachis-furcata BCC 54312]|uniref:Uncharacterized protein n=1 Tax=Ophiocordyceps polyrhachis-furcata BCC 54312 TaxID=1330021 RepID=A0A367LD53_9HYPO|nr:hypothetical protein L249_0210 [Ophiocordyceps polyrhachis-furcata BCC 54312]